MIIGRLLIAVVLFVGMALPAGAKEPNDVSCPSKTYIRSCPVDSGAAATLIPSLERPCSGKAILANLIPERFANVSGMVYHHAPATDATGTIWGGIERPPKFSLS